MDLFEIFQAVENTGLATWLRQSVYALPIVNALHVISLAMVFGTISIVDLRMLGVASASRPFTTVADELLKWTWLSFGLAAATGLVMVTANATTFYANDEFWWKMLLLVLAGLNMAVFELVTRRSVAQWDRDKNPPAAVKFAGAASLILWISIIVLGRWIGYTKGFNFDIPVDIDLDSFLR